MVDQGEHLIYVTRDTIPMLKKIKQLYDFVDATTAQIQQSHPEEVKCHPGCGDCCHAMFDISLIEACYLAQQLTDQDAPLDQWRQAAEEAQASFQAQRQTAGDPAKARIRCPLLGPDDLCRCYGGRPINCRTYGTPTMIEGQGHVCGLSGFQAGGDYPTINLAPLQKSLFEYSEAIAPGHGHQRFTIAQVILFPQRFLLPPADK
ncbi:MAG: YkgJ family cysteine cluster protein [Thermodesulfobacteriota bacterium]